jgi:ferredoxin
MNQLLKGALWLTLIVRLFLPNRGSYNWRRCRYYYLETTGISRHPGNHNVLVIAVHVDSRKKSGEVKYDNDPLAYVGQDEWFHKVASCRPCGLLVLYI